MKLLNYKKKINLFIKNFKISSMKLPRRFIVILFIILILIISFMPVLLEKINKFFKNVEPETLIIKEIDKRLEEVEESNEINEITELNEIVGFNEYSNESAFEAKDEVSDKSVELSAEEYYSLGELYQNGKFGREKNANMAIINFDKAIQLADSNDHDLLGKCHLSLAQIHENSGSESSAPYMINHYLQALKFGYEESIIHIGKLYMNGLHPFYLPDKMMAAKIFTTFINFSENIKPWCKLHLQDIYKVQYKDLDTIRQNDISYHGLPDNIVDRMLMSSNEIRHVHPYKLSFDKNLLKSTYDDEDDEFPKNRKLKPAKGTPKKPSILLRLPKQVVHNDSQNVHDHSLQNIGNIIIDKLGKENKNTNNFETNRRSLLSGLDEKKYPNVKRVCDSLGDVVHSRFEKSEKDVFNLVWERVKDNNDLKLMFIDNLNSGVEHNYVVCSTGKIMRMLSTLDIVDNKMPDLKPEWVIKQEIMQTIANTINKLSSKERKQYESDNNATIKKVIEKRVHTKCLNDYKDILQENILDLYLNEYLEHI